jgi:hypothetical protein
MVVRVRWGAALALGWVAACDLAAPHRMAVDGAGPGADAGQDRAAPARDSGLLPPMTTNARDAGRGDRASADLAGAAPVTPDGSSVAADAALPAGDGGDPFAAAARCTSGTSWSKGNGDQMAPGRSCIKCHALTVGGTVYPSAHEPDDCNGAAGSARSGWATVVIVDANGGTESLSVNQAGNFSLDHVTLAAPLRVKVVFMGRERAMLEPAPSGDCNACHTQAGASKAPGRILLP